MSVIYGRISPSGVLVAYRGGPSDDHDHNRRSLHALPSAAWSYGSESDPSYQFHRNPYNTVSSRMKVGPDMTRFERMEINRTSWAANVSSLHVQQKEQLGFT